jgi:anti-anti-sigma regulatory factor
MTVIAVWIKIDEQQVVQALREAGEKLNSADEEVLLDFAAVRRLDPKALRAMEEFSDIAQRQGVKVVLRGVNVDVYKVLKLVKVAKRFSFVS